MASLIPRPAPIKCSVIQTQGQAELGGAADRFSIRDQSAVIPLHGKSDHKFEQRIQQAKVKEDQCNFMFDLDN